MKKKLISFSVIAMLLFGVALLAFPAKAAPVQPLSFNFFVNNVPIAASKSILYQGHTYVQLRELAPFINASIDFANDPNHMPLPGGRKPDGVHISIPTYIYVNKKVPLYDLELLKQLKELGKVKESKDGKFFEGVDVTELYNKYCLDYEQNKGKHLKYAFKYDPEKRKEYLAINDGKTVKKEYFLSECSYERMYVPVQEFKDHIQPYLTDICMQDQL